MAPTPAALAKFYTELLGWKIEMMEGFEDYWEITTSAAEGALGGGMTKRMVPQQGPLNYVLVESVADYLAKAAGLGAMVVVEKTEVPNCERQVRRAA